MKSQSFLWFSVLKLVPFSLSLGLFWLRFGEVMKPTFNVFITMYLVALAKIDIFYIYFKMTQFLVRSTMLTHGHPMVFPLFPRQHGEVTAFLNPDGQVAVVVRNLGFQNNSAEAAHHQKNPAFGFLVVFLCDFLLFFGKQSQMAFGDCKSWLLGCCWLCCLGLEGARCLMQERGGGRTEH